MKSSTLLTEPLTNREKLAFASILFMSAIAENANDIIEQEGIEDNDGLNMLQRAGVALRQLIHTYTSHDINDLIAEVAVQLTPEAIDKVTEVLTKEIFK